MLVLLPPSEGKTPPTAGAPVDLDALTDPELTPHRGTVLDALADASARADALEVLRVPPTLRSEVERNRTLLQAPAAPAHTVYTGVLYTAAGLGRGQETGGAERDEVHARLRDDIRTVSALWGLLGPLDRVPAYRLSMGCDLPGPGPLARYWRPALTEVLAARTRDDVVVDCRSAAYAAAWRAPADVDIVNVRVLRELDGRRSVVSHHAKHARGVLTGHLLRRAAPTPRDADGLLAAARELIGTHLLDAQLHDGRGRARVLELVTA